MRRRALAVLLLLATVPAAAQQQPRAYSLRDIRLGTSISELRQLTFVDEEDRPGLRLICSNEPDASRLERLRLTMTDRPGAVRCAVFEKADTDDPRPWTLDYLGGQTQPTMILYRRELDRELRVAQIVGTMPNNRFQQIIALMQKAYGSPSGYEMSGMGTMLGSDMLNATYHWNNGISSIRADLLSVELDKMTLVFTHEDIMREVNQFGSRLIGPR
jgi:hypothetical protein